MKILLFGGALRKGSYNRLFAREAERLLSGMPDVQTTFVDLRDFDIPVYDGDYEDEKGIPAGVVRLGQLVREADGLVVSTPEYNGSIPGVLKNVLDWLSREDQVSLFGKHLLLLAASPGALGGIRSLWHSRVPFEVLKVRVHNEVMGLSHADEAFDGEGRLKDEKTRKRLQTLLDGFVSYLRS